MAIVHHGRYLPYLEAARVEYLRHLGHPYTEWREAGVDAAVLEVFVQYRQALRFDDVVDVHVRLASATRTTFQMAYLLTRDGDAVATGVTVHGLINESGRPVRLPDWLIALGAGRLEELDDVAGRILEQDLLAAGPFDDVVAERRAGVAEPGDLGVDVVDDEVDAVPAAGSGLGAVRHRPPRRARRPGEQQPQVAALDVGERGRGARQHLEAEQLACRRRSPRRRRRPCSGR